jgi:transcriptional regulator with XRE-family HTH domain
MNIIDRIREIIKYKGISTRKFCIDVGIANGFLDKVRDVGSEKLMKILNAYPELSVEWLLTGNGQMLKESQPVKEEKKDEILPTQQIFELLKAQLEEKDRQIATLTEALKEVVKNDIIAPAEKQRRAVR